MKRLLIANRGEIAVRIARTARAMGIETVLVASEPDQNSLAARSVDRVAVVGPAPASASYLDVDAVMAAAAEHDVDAVHPGFGFLSENADFAARVVAAGLAWVGPAPDAIRLMGDKIAARRAAVAAGVPVIAGSDGPVADEASALRTAAELGFPLVIKASAGGGGRGIRLVRTSAEFLPALDIVRAEARAAFGDDAVYLERYIEHARHIEVQVLADGVDAIHLGDRDCSMQRRSQKVLEEAPAPDLPPAVRDQIRATSVELALACGYSGAGTVEFLYDPQRQEAAFIEMNTRIQVEHPVTEAITGIDIVEHQLRIASGEKLSIRQDDVVFSGHAFECRINAEDPARNFFPSPGLITRMEWPHGAGVRVDAGFDEGAMVLPFYDSMIAKLIVHAADRPAAIAATASALQDVKVEGIATTLSLHRVLLARPELAAVSHWTTFIESTPGVLEESA